MVLVGATTAQAAEAPAETLVDDRAVIVVTGVSRATDPLDTSISISTVAPDSVLAAGARGTAALFGSLPGIRSESSAGGGNSNITVRGLPLVTGGGQFVSLQEDGLPVLLFGDHNFAPADGFIKVDTTLARIETVRGGSAATLATNGNGAIINLISKTGSTAGGSLLVTKGLDYRDSRIDAEYGGPIAENLHFHVGGHYQIGGDYRHLGYDAIEGGKLRVSVSRTWAGGFVRLYGQVIDKKDATFLPQPVRLTEVPGSVAAVAAGATRFGTVLGSLSNSIAGLDAANQTLHSRDLFGFPVVDDAGRIVRTNLREGIHTRARTIGAALELDLGSGVTLSEKVRYQSLGGRFVAPFTNAVNDADSYIASRFGAAARAVFLSGTDAGLPATSATLRARTGNGLITELALFDTELNDMGNVTNDLRLAKTFRAGGGNVAITAGYFAMRQNFEQRWHWGRVLVSTQAQPAIIDVPGATEDGVYSYNGAFGRCCNILWDMSARVDALYGDVDARFGALGINASVRRERMRYSGFAQFNSARDIDVNGDGTIGPAEIGVPIGDPSTRGDIGGSLPGTSWSLGLNYRLSPALSVFTRYSDGTTWNFDRQFGAFDRGGIVEPGLLRNGTRQIEAGAKWRDQGGIVPGSLSASAAYFNTRANLRNFSVTQNQASGGIYGSDGVEFEFGYDHGKLKLVGNLTWTQARVKQDFRNPARNGLIPRRQAEWIFNAGASYTVRDRLTFGAAASGTADSFVDFENRFVQPGYTVINAFISLLVRDNLTLSVSASNLFDVTGFTEGDESRLFDTDGNGAFDTTIGRSITGRTVSLSARFGL